MTHSHLKQNGVHALNTTFRWFTLFLRWHTGGQSQATRAQHWPYSGTYFAVKLGVASRPCVAASKCCAKHLVLPMATVAPLFLLAVAASRKLGLCEPSEADDTSVALCESWCSDASHCAYCKCRGCSLCKPCTPSATDDSQFEVCESWCAVAEHCTACKCKGCEFCRGHHPERSCSPHQDAEDDPAYETCQPWCRDGEHCRFCKCKGCASCSKGAHEQQSCTPKDRSDTSYADCEVSIRDDAHPVSKPREDARNRCHRVL